MTMQRLAPVTEVARPLDLLGDRTAFTSSSDEEGAADARRDAEALERLLSQF